MTREELITKGEHKVRRDADLMLSYLEEFEKLFGRKPDCAGCTFKKDWARFSKGSVNNNTVNNFTMKTKKTFELVGKANSIIHTYRVGKIPKRTYGNKMSEEFALAYLSNGTKQEIELRKGYFKTLPKVKVEKVKPEKIEVVQSEIVAPIEKVNDAPITKAKVSKKQTPKKKRTSKKSK